MKVSDVIHGRIATISLKRPDGGEFPEGVSWKSEVRLFFEDGLGCRLHLGEEIVDVAGADPQDEDVLSKIAGRALPRLAWVAQQPGKDGMRSRLLLQTHEFPASYDWSDPFEFGVDDKIIESMRKRRERLVSPEAVRAWLTDRLLLPPQAQGGGSRVLLSGSPNRDSKKTAFRVYGHLYAADIERGVDGRLLVTRVVESRKAVEGDEATPIYLVTGRISFVDATIAGAFRGIAQSELDNLVAHSDSYLGLWKEYNRLELEAVVGRAKQFKWIRYESRAQLPDGAWRFRLSLKQNESSEVRQRLRSFEGAYLAAGQDVPSAIQGAQLGEEANATTEAFMGELIADGVSPPTVTLRPPPDDSKVPPEQGYLFLSLVGDTVRLGRRRRAWNRIRSCENPMPQLGLLIEGAGPVSTAKRPHREPLNRAVRDVFKNPNDRQRIALDVALNTPDIALIQGPPGTGKTKVIAALQARLAAKDEGADPDGLSGSTLLTSAQHDAVENAAAATRVMGLPAVKIGYRRGSEVSRDEVEAWAAETAQLARAGLAASAPEDSLHGALNRLREQAIAYTRSPRTRDQSADILLQTVSCAAQWLPSSLIAEIADLQIRIASEAKGGTPREDLEFALKAVRALRTDDIAFSDDGPQNALKAFRRIDRLEGFSLGSDMKMLLEEAAQHDSNSPPGHRLLAGLKEVQGSLIDRIEALLAPPSVVTAHADVEGVLARIIDEMHHRASASASGVPEAVNDWISTLENDPTGLRATVQHYSMVLAATCQQSVSREMESIKGGDDTVFRSVVIDEAARANPLDLLIPMAVAERRIILVGDHRQLPHILEPEIEREVQKSIKEETRSALKRSLFERLFAELKAREQQDGVKRTVTLNVQYRMHRLLGDFVSAQFYEPHGEGFSSARPDEEFVHKVTLGDGTMLGGRVAAWVDVPALKGAESSGRSKSREPEARRVANEALAIVSRHQDLSVGIITFYSAQRDAIFEQLDDVGLTELDDEGGSRVRDQWRRTIDGRERLRVGTVDAFQGKEFDVVLLSLTRSNSVEVTDEASRRRKYGFLLLENRLCVAMSRQHRLLIVIGDLAMASGPTADASVPSLVAFARLCGSGDGLVVRS